MKPKETTAITKTPIKPNDPYSSFVGICEHCNKYILWCEPYLIGEFGLLMYHLDCDKAYNDF